MTKWTREKGKWISCLISIALKLGRFVEKYSIPFLELFLKSTLNVICLTTLIEQSNAYVIIRWVNLKRRSSSTLFIYVPTL